MTSENESHSEEKTKKDKKHKKSKVTTQITMFNKTIPFDTTTKMGQILLSTLKINNLVKDSTVNKVTTKKTDIIYTKITTTKKLVTIETSTKTPKIENIINLTSPEITKKVQLFPEITTTKPTIYYISETPNNIFLKTKIINN
ncbi:Hypothetical protein SRAE_0000012300 [Strongyloides ratti]|uniref:Uncharacterized protein n=1 Tax=Strongyloides ratti TaxID=34506 RepID=A0A090KU95_STRRB|nr:Hypothetical protein SRAE_0000012300 [Strongyloides ratti]CEF60991.1 Hypothetical protein SRAE_0000012300 [Strongyloides ratti]